MRTRDFLVGVTFFGLLTLLGVFTIFLADFRLGAGHEMVVPFTDVGGLAEGAEVRIDGLTSGRVRGMERGPKGDRVMVTLSFDREPVLADDATFEISSASPLGGRVVEIWSNPSTRKRSPSNDSSRDSWLPDNSLPIISLTISSRSASFEASVAILSPSRRTVMRSPTCFTSSNLWEM